MTSYDHSFDPPAPIAKIALRKIETGERIKDISVLLDTGADVSLIPSPAIGKLNIKPSGDKVKLVGFDESENLADVYEMQVIFLGKRLTGDYCAIDDEIGVLGRDVLNQFSIILMVKVWNGKKKSDFLPMSLLNPFILIFENYVRFLEQFK